MTRGDDLFTQEELDNAYRGTLVFLYRVLFLLYAESRNLLPVREIHDYHEISFKKIREEIGTAGGVAFSDRDRRLGRAPSPRCPHGAENGRPRATRREAATCAPTSMRAR